MGRHKEKMLPLTQEQKDLLTKNIPLIWWEVRRNRPRNEIQVEEWVQEAVFGAARAIQTHDPSKSKLSTWIVMYIRGVIGKLKRRFAEKEYAVQLGDNVEKLGGWYTPKDKDDALAMAIRCLRKEDQVLIEMRFYRGLGLAEMGEELGVSTERVRQKLNRVLKLVKREYVRLEGDYDMPNAAKIYKRSSWYNVIDGKWRLLAEDGDETIVLAVLEKDRYGMWQGRVPPRPRNHLLPRKSLKEMMAQAELFVHERDKVTHALCS